MAKNSSPSRAPKTGAQLQTTWRSAKNGLKKPKNPSSPPYPAGNMPVSVRTGMSTNSGDEPSLRHLQHETWRRCMITATSITVDELHNMDIDHLVITATAEIPQFSALSTPVVKQQRASQPFPRTPRRSSAQFALWEHVAGAQLKSPPLCR